MKTLLTPTVSHNFFFPQKNVEEKICCVLAGELERGCAKVSSNNRHKGLKQAYITNPVHNLQYTANRYEILLIAPKSLVYLWFTQW